MLDDMFIFVDDSPYNLKKSTATFTIALTRPWNTNVVAVRFNILQDVIEKCEILLKCE